MPCGLRTVARKSGSWKRSSALPRLGADALGPRAPRPWRLPRLSKASPATDVTAFGGRPPQSTRDGRSPPERRRQVRVSGTLVPEQACVAIPPCRRPHRPQFGLRLLPVVSYGPGNLCEARTNLGHGGCPGSRRLPLTPRGDVRCRDHVRRRVASCPHRGRGAAGIVPVLPRVLCPGPPGDPPPAAAARRFRRAGELYGVSCRAFCLYRVARRDGCASLRSERPRRPERPFHPAARSMSSPAI